MKNSQVSFTSNIRLASANRFAKEIESLTLKEAVSPPWTANEIVVGPRAYTTKIYDCIAGGITDGKKVLMFHLCPTYEQNADFSIIEQAILEKFGGKIDGLKGLLLGNKSKFRASNDLFDKLKGFMEGHKIDFSTIKGVKKDEYSSLAYDLKSDTWTISSDYIASELKKGVKLLKSILERVFEVVQISHNDKLIRN